MSDIDGIEDFCLSQFQQIRENIAGSKTELSDAGCKAASQSSFRVTEVRVTEVRVTEVNTVAGHREHSFHNLSDEPASEEIPS